MYREGETKPIPWPPTGIGGTISHFGKGMLTLYQYPFGQLGFSLARAQELRQYPGFEHAVDDMLITNNLVGSSPSDLVDTDSVAPSIQSRNGIPIADATQWNTFRIYINRGTVGTHRLSVFANDGPLQSLDVTAGPAVVSGEYKNVDNGTSYLAMGSSPESQFAFDVDYLMVSSTHVDASQPPYAGDGSRSAIPYASISPNKWMPVPAIPEIDSTFIPSRKNGPCVISSEGHTFAACPSTDGMARWNIHNGWRVPWETNPMSMLPHSINERCGISLPTNTGITFDLNALRNTMADTRLTAFKTQLGWPGTPPSDGGTVGLWVLVDGDVRYAEEHVQPGQWFDCQVSLEHKDRFLSLVATEQEQAQAGLRNEHDTCFFAEPILELTTKP
jgi:hypothetical protein